MGTERWPPPIERVFWDAVHGPAPARDEGVRIPLADSISFFESECTGVGFDVLSIERQETLAGGSVYQALSRCWSGSQLDKRVESLSRYGPRLQEVVALRERITEVGHHRYGATPAIFRRATVRVCDTPAWVQMAVSHHRTQTALCGVCKREVRDVMLGWLCTSC